VRESIQAAPPTRPCRKSCIGGPGIDAYWLLRHCPEKLLPWRTRARRSSSSSRPWMRSVRASGLPLSADGESKRAWKTGCGRH